MERKPAKVAFHGNSIVIVCTDLVHSVWFYEELLGAEPLPTNDGYGCPWYQLGALTFSLMPNASDSCPIEFPTHAGAMLWLETDDLESAHRYLVQNGVPMIEWHEGEFAIVTDPDGLLIEIWQAEPE